MIIPKPILRYELACQITKLMAFARNAHSLPPNPSQQWIQGMNEWLEPHWEVISTTEGIRLRSISGVDIFKEVENMLLDSYRMFALEIAQLVQMPRETLVSMGKSLEATLQRNDWDSVRVNAALMKTFRDWPFGE